MQNVHAGAPAIMKQLRGHRSQQEVADALGTTQQAMARYETGTRVPGDEMKSKIAEFYGVSVTDIFYRGIHQTGK